MLKRPFTLSDQKLPKRINPKGFIEAIFDLALIAGSFAAAGLLVSIGPSPCSLSLRHAR
jgi:hypothetical protein